MSVSPTSAEAFEAMYQANPDPWDFAHAPYERSRYDAIVASLPRRRFGFGFEPGCSVGELTALVAPHCDGYQAIDISPTAVERARARCAGLTHVDIRVAALPNAIPTQEIDLLVLSEIGYYFEERTLAGIAATLRDRLAVHAVTVACHWLGSSADHVLTGDRVHEILANGLGDPTDGGRADDFRIDLWTRPS